MQLYGKEKFGVERATATQRFGPGSSTAISSTAVSSTLGSSKLISSTNKYLDFKGDV